MSAGLGAGREIVTLCAGVLLTTRPAFLPGGSWGDIGGTWRWEEIPSSLLKPD